MTGFGVREPAAPVVEQSCGGPGISAASAGALSGAEIADQPGASLAGPARRRMHGSVGPRDCLRKVSDLHAALDRCYVADGITRSALEHAIAVAAKASLDLGKRPHGEKHGTGSEEAEGCDVLMIPVGVAPCDHASRLARHTKVQRYRIASFASRREDFKFTFAVEEVRDVLARRLRLKPNGDVLRRGVTCVGQYQTRIVAEAFEPRPHLGMPLDDFESSLLTSLET